jgi:hypothetical protein
MADLTLREATLDDQAAVDAVRVRCGLEPERAPGAWEWLWRVNPDATPQMSPGWVLEHQGRIAGFIGCVPRSYHFRGRRWKCVAARAFVVEREFARDSLRLVAAFFTRGDADLLLNTSANATAAAIFRASGALALPQPHYDESLVWPVSGAGLAASWLRRRGVGNALAAVAGRAVGPIADAAQRLDARVPAAPGATVRRYDPGEAGETFDRLWQDLCAEWPDRLLARRDGAALRWQWGHPAAASRQAVILAMESAGVLNGYAVVIREDSVRYGLKRARIVDLIARDDSAVTLRALIGAAYQHAREQRVHVLDMVGFPSSVRAVALDLRPLTAPLAAVPFWYRTVNRELGAALAGATAWYASPCDGDAAL